MKHIILLRSMSACEEAIEFAKKYDSLQDAWDNCHRGDWMLRLLEKTNYDKRELVRLAGKCAEYAKHLMKDESLAALEACKQYSAGNITDDELSAAAADADDAVDAVADDVFAGAEIHAAATAAAYAAAGDASDAANAAAYAGERDSILKKQADMIRDELKNLTDGKYGYI